MRSVMAKCTLANAVPLGPAAGHCGCQPALQSPWRRSSANHRHCWVCQQLQPEPGLLLSTFNTPGWSTLDLSWWDSPVVSFGASSQGHRPHGSKGVLLYPSCIHMCRAWPLLVQEDTAGSLWGTKELPAQHCPPHEPLCPPASCEQPSCCLTLSLISPVLLIKAEQKALVSLVSNTTDRLN